MAKQKKVLLYIIDNDKEYPKKWKIETPFSSTSYTQSDILQRFKYEIMNLFSEIGEEVDGTLSAHYDFEKLTYRVCDSYCEYYMYTDSIKEAREDFEQCKADGKTDIRLYEGIENLNGDDSEEIQWEIIASCSKDDLPF